MTLKQSCFVLITVLAFVFSTYGYVMPESGFAPEPMDVITYTYTDSYWDVTPNGSESGYWTNENDEVLPIYENATLNFYGTVTSDYNPWAQTQCQWNQNMMLLDMTMQQLLEMGSLTGWGTTTMGHWNLTGSSESAFQLNANVGIDSCGPTMPQMPPGGVGGTIIDGISGTSHSRYLVLFSPIPNPVLYQYRHNTAHTREQCPAQCAMKIPQVVVYFGLYPGHELDLKLPFDKNGICDKGSWEPEIITRNECYNTYDFPW